MYRMILTSQPEGVPGDRRGKLSEPRIRGRNLYSTPTSYVKCLNWQRERVYIRRKLLTVPFTEKFISLSSPHRMKSLQRSLECHQQTAVTIVVFIPRTETQKSQRLVRSN